MNIYEFHKDVKTKDDFSKFLELFLKEFKENGSNWENGNLHNFLEALSAASSDIEGYYQNTNQVVDINNPTWKMFAELLLSAIVYE